MKTWILHEEGEPNKFTIIDDGVGWRKKWFMTMQFNGELTVEQQRVLANAMLEIVNNLEN